MSLARRKPFTLLAAFIAVTLLILAYTTKKNACEGQVDRLDYAKIDNDTSTWCFEQCSDDVASKKIAYITSPRATNSTTRASNASETVGLKIVIRCGWSGTTGRLFVACSLIMLVWVVMELLLASKRKFPFLLNQLLILVIGLGIPTAIYQLHDIHDRTCSAITTPDGTAQDTLCYRFLYNLSFVLTIVIMVLLMGQLFYNIVRRREINEEDHKYADISQENNLRNNYVPPVINPGV